MKTTGTHCQAILLLVAMTCVANFPPVARAQGNAIATMDIDGDNAFVDNAPQRASSRGIRILDGSLVRTGQRTSARVEIIPEGGVQLRENSAKLITTSFFKGTKCFAVRLITGELFINGENVCFRTNVGAVSGISHSRIDIKVDERGTVLTVIEGMAELDGQPASMLVSASEQLVVLPNGEYYKKTLDPAAAERTAEWTRNYFNTAPKEKMSTGKKAALGILGAVILGAVIHEVTDDDDDDDRDKPSPPQSAPPSPAPRTVQCCMSPNDDAAPWSAARVEASQCDYPNFVIGRNAPCPPMPTPTPASELPSHRVLKTSPVYVPLARPGPCCIGGLNGTTEQFTPAQCAAKGGDQGVCTIVH